MNLNQLTLSNIKGYLQGNFRRVLKDFGATPDYIVQQALWRLERVKENSPECFKQDECIHCNCQVSAKVFEDRGCEHGCYEKMMSEEQWEKFIYDWHIIDKNSYVIGVDSDEGLSNFKEKEQ